MKQSFAVVDIRIHLDDWCTESRKLNIGLRRVISKLSTSLARALMWSSIPTPPLSCFRIILARITVYSPRLI